MKLTGVTIGMFLAVGGTVAALVKTAAWLRGTVTTIL